MNRQGRLRGGNVPSTAVSVHTLAFAGDAPLGLTPLGKSRLTLAAAGEAADSSPSGANTPEQRGSGGSSVSRAEIATQRRLAAVSEADTLAARYRSLVQRRRRTRSALRVLEVSEKGRAALEAGAETPGQLGARAEEAMKVGGWKGLPAGW